MIRNEMRRIISEAVRQVSPGIKTSGFSVEPPENPAFGDYATNAALVLAKQIGREPMEIAQELQKQIANRKSQIAGDIEIAEPGFVNFFLSDEYLLSGLADVLKQPEQWGRSDTGRGKTVVVEYFQLNIAKRPHVGHLRSAVIGDALKRVFLSQGYHAVSDTHVGDWGTQFGILLFAYKRALAAGDVMKNAVEADPFQKLDEIYIRANEEEGIIEKGKGEFAKLEQGDEENRKIWQWMVEVSMKKLEESTAVLSLLPFDEHKGESSYENDMPAIVEEALKKNIAKKIEDGAVVVDLTGEGLDEAILIKSDGASTYLLRDLATILYRKQKWNFWKNVYVVDNRQAHHFRQVFRVAKLLGYEGVGDSIHVDFGFMKLPEGAMSTRKGNVIFLEKLIDEGVSRAKAVIKEKNPDLKNADDIARQVGLGAIKYFDLSHNRRSDITFRWDDALSFEGNTGPYLQYTHARLKSILRKAAMESPTLALPLQKREGTNTVFLPPLGEGGRRQMSLPPAGLLHNELDESNPRDGEDGGVRLDSLEHRLLANVLRFPEAIEDALADYAPHVLAHYLYQLASLANEFYHSHPVLQEKDETIRGTRLAIVEGVALTLEAGLSLLGIDAPAEM